MFWIEDDSHVCYIHCLREYVLIHQDIVSSGYVKRIVLRVRD